MKQSTLVQLVLLGSAATAYGAFSDSRIALSQHSYNSTEACREDWSDEPACSQSGPDGRVYGPRYYWDTGRNRPVIVDRDGTARPGTGARFVSESGAHGTTHAAGFTRGGFGSIGHGFGRGG